MRRLMDLSIAQVFCYETRLNDGIAVDTATWNQTAVGAPIRTDDTDRRLGHDDCVAGSGTKLTRGPVLFTCSAVLAA